MWPTQYPPRPPGQSWRDCDFGRNEVCSPAVGRGSTVAHLDQERRMPDVIKLLEQDHNDVGDLFADSETMSGAAQQLVVAKNLADGVRDMTEANGG